MTHPHILFVAATPMELEPLRVAFSDLPCHFLIHEVGILSTCFHLSRALATHTYTYVVQVGIAGSFDIHTYPIGSCVAVKEELLGRWGVVEEGIFQDIFTMGLIHKNAPPFTNGRLINPNPHLDLICMPLVRSVSVCEISTHPEMIAFYRHQYQSDIENMEGAALHYVCLQYGIPFLQCRAISNAVGERDKKDWVIQEGLHELLIILQQQVRNLLLPN